MKNVGRRFRERGSVPTIWIVVGVVFCVLAGATLEKCLSHAHADDGKRAVVHYDPSMQGSAFDEPAPARYDDAAARDNPDLEVAIEPELPAKNGDELPPLEKPERAAKPGVLHLTWDDLGGYDYKFPDITEDADPKPTNQIPETHLKLDGETISITGFIIPIRPRGNVFTEFVLVPNQMFCHYGRVPQMNEWIHVTMAPGKETTLDMTELPATIQGELAVGEVWDNGVVMSLYRCTATSVTAPKSFR